MQEKTNVMRLLTQKNIPYNFYFYPNDKNFNGVEVAEFLKIDKTRAFKTLVTQGKSGKYYVFDIPVDKELDLKKSANFVREKSVAMVKSKDLLGLTGYIHGGCSPIGMKKFFTTTFDKSLTEGERVFFSGGRVGAFVEISVEDLQKIITYSITDLTV